MKKTIIGLLSCVVVLSVLGFLFIFASPTIEYVNPTPVLNFTPNNWIYINITSNENLNKSLLEWGNSSGFTNVSMDNSSMINWYFNMTNLIENYKFNYSVFSQNTSGNWNQSKRKYIIIDITKPIIKINEPKNKDFLNNHTIEINLTITELHLNYTNISIFNSTNALINSTKNYTNGTNIIKLSVSADGNYTINATSYDNATNYNTTAINITIDTIKPTLTILSPKSRNYSIMKIWFNTTVNDIYPYACWYSFNKGIDNYSLTNSSGNWNDENESMTDNTEFNVTFYCNDSAGNIGNSTVSFAIDTSIPPIITILSPENKTYNTNSILFNITADDDNPYRFWYSLDGGFKSEKTEEYSEEFLENDMIRHYYNASNDSMTDGQHNITFYCEDRELKENSKSILFTIDTTPPIITIYLPQQYTQNFALNWSANEDLFNISYTLNNGENISLYNESWYVDNINKDLGDIGDNSAPTIFQKDSTWYLISGEDDGVFYGFNWTGTEWQTDTNIVNGLSITSPSFSKPNTFYKNNNLYLITGKCNGEFEGFNWTGTEWQTDNNIISGLGDVGDRSTPNVFQKDSTWYLISGEVYGVFYGFNWTGTEWQQDENIVNGLCDIGDNSAPTVFQKDSNLYLISGAYNGNFYGFKWNGTQWEPDNVINLSLGDIGENSAPTIFEKDNILYLISGNQTGGFTGFNWTKIFFNTTIQLQEGQNNLTLYGTDLVKWTNSTKKTLIFSFIKIESPKNNSKIYDEYIWFNITSDYENTSKCWYELDEKNNFTLDNDTTTHFYNKTIIEKGDHNVTFYCNNTDGNEINSNMHFFYFDNASRLITDCANLDLAGFTYLLNNSKNSTDDVCINISKNNITLDCQGNTINGNNTGNYGILINRSSSTPTNIVIKNCTIKNYKRGIYIISSFGNKLENLTLINNSFFDFFTEAKTDADCNNKLNNVIGTDNKPIAYFNDTVNLKNWDNNASQIILCNADNSVLDNIVLNHTFKNNGFFILNTDNSNISNMVLNNLEMGLTLMSSANNTFDNITTNNNEEYGIGLFNSSNNNFTNITTKFNNLFGGIFLFVSNHNNTFDNIESNNNWNGISLTDSNFTTLANSTIQNNSNAGIYILESKNNSFYNNIFNNTENIDFEGIIYQNNWNTTNHTGKNIIGKNYIGGNYWTNPNGNGFSDTCLDNTGDFICENSYTINDTNIDYLPLTNKSDTSAILINNCTNLSTANKTYYLTSNVLSNSTCFTIEANNITLNCQNKIINYSILSVGYGINNSGFNNTIIKNCALKQSGTNTNSYGIYINESFNLTIQNNSINTTTSYPIFIEGTNITNFNHTIINNLEQQKEIYYYFNNNSVILNNKNTGQLYFAYSNNANISNSTINGVVLFNSKNIALINSTYLKAKKHNSTLLQYWFLDVLVKNLTGIAVNEANVSCWRGGKLVFSENTTSDGKISTHKLLVYNNTNYNPFTIRATKKNQKQDEKKITIDKNTQVNLVLNQVPQIKINYSYSNDSFIYFNFYVNETQANTTTFCKVNITQNAEELKTENLSKSNFSITDNYKYSLLNKKYEEFLNNNYTLNITCYDNIGGQNSTWMNFTIKDTTKPNIGNPSYSKTKTSVNITITSTNEKMNCSIKNLNAKNYSSATFSISQKFIVSGLSAGTTYKYNLSCWDINNQGIEEFAEKSFTTISEGGSDGSSGSGDSGSGGGDGYATASHVWDKVEKNKKMVFNVANSKIPVEKIIFYLKKTKSNVKITIKSIDKPDEPENIDEEKYIIKNYFSIITENIEKADLEKIIIKFYLEKASISDKNKIRLLHYTGSFWLVINPYKIDTSGTKYNFYAKPSKFSYFAVVEEKPKEEDPIVPPVDDDDTTTDVPPVVDKGEKTQDDEDTIFQSTEEKEKTNFFKFLIPVLIIILVAGGIGIYFMLQSKKIQKEENEKLNEDRELLDELDQIITPTGYENNEDNLNETIQTNSSDWYSINEKYKREHRDVVD